MENMDNNDISRIFVEDLSRIGGIKVTLKKQDKSDFQDSEVDKMFWDACQYSKHGLSGIQRFGSSLVITFKNVREGREFIKKFDSENNKININNIFYVVFSEIHDINSETQKPWVEMSLARKGGGRFTDLEIQSIFWNAFQYASLSGFSSSDEKELRLYFRDVNEWYEFMSQFGGEDDRDKFKAKIKKKGFFERIAEMLNKSF